MRFTRQTWLVISALILFIGTVSVRPQARPESGSASPANSPSPKQDEPALLVLNKPIQRQIEADEKHSYQLQLRAGQYVRVTVQQKGVDLMITLAGPTEEEIESVNRTGLLGLEEITHVCKETGAYTIVVERAEDSDELLEDTKKESEPDSKQNQEKQPSGAPAQRYEIRLVELRDATSQDRLLVEAHELSNDTSELITQEDYEAAQKSAERGLEIRKRLLGAEDTLVADSLADLASVYAAKKTFATAEILYKQSLSIYEKKYGVDQISTLEALESLVKFYEQQDRDDTFEKTEPLSRRILAIKERALGIDHPAVRDHLPELVGFYVDAGDVAKAELLLQHMVLKATPENKEVLSDVLEAFRNLINFCTLKSNFDKAHDLTLQWIAVAEKLYGKDSTELIPFLKVALSQKTDKILADRMEQLMLRAVAEKEKSVGADSEENLSALIDLAGLYKGKGDYAKAEPLYLRALTINEKAKSLDGWQLQTILTSLAEMYMAKDDLTQAETYLQKARAIKGGSIGLDFDLCQLAEHYQEKHDDAKAEQLYQSALAIELARVRTESSPQAGIDDFTAADYLSRFYMRRKEYAQAEALYRRVLSQVESKLGPVHALVANILDKLADFYTERNELNKVETLRQRALSILQRANGSEHRTVANQTYKLATYYSATGNDTEAERFFLRAIEITERNKDSVYASYLLNDLAHFYANRHRSSDAEQVFRRILAEAEADKGSNSPAVAEALGNIGDFYFLHLDFEKAEQYYLRAMEIYERPENAQSPLSFQIFDKLGDFYLRKGDYAKAESSYERLLAMKRKASQPDGSDAADAISEIGVVFAAKGDYAKARQLYLQALTIYEKTSGAESSAARVLKKIAELAVAQGDVDEGEQLYLRALGIFEKVAKENKTGLFDSSEIPRTLESLALLYVQAGDLKKAEDLYLRALKATADALGPDNVQMDKLLADLATAYFDNGKFEEAEQALQSALVIVEKSEAEHPGWVATALENFAEFYREREQFVKAESLLRRALATRQKPDPYLGVDNFLVADSTVRLADILRKKGNLSESARLYDQAYATHQRLLSTDTSYPTLALERTAELYYSLGEFARAEPFFAKLLEAEEKEHGANAPGLANLLDQFSLLSALAGDTSKAVSLASRALQIQEGNIKLNTSIGSDRQKMAYLASLSRSSSFNVSLHTDISPQNPDALRLALTSVLQRKGRAVDVMSESFASLRRSLTPQAQEILEELSATRSHLAALVFKEKSSQESQPDKELVSRLEERIEQLESEVSKVSSEFKVESRPVTIEQVQAALPKGAALVEIVYYRPFYAKGKSPAEILGSHPRYAAYVLPKVGQPHGVPLGESEKIDILVARLRASLSRRSSTDVKQVANELYGEVIRPVKDMIGGANQLFISPDGALNLIPFGALIDDSGKYLIETYPITYLTSGRDLLRLSAPEENRQGPLIVANPSFDAQQTVNPQAPISSDRPLGRRSADASQLRFGPLPGTAGEAEQLKALLGVAPLTEGAATESAVKQAHGPSILHIATHGFFLSDQKRLEDQVGIWSSPSGSTLADSPILNENPLLRSGLALAGANLRQGGNGEDGILTALEVSALDLRSTRLVVLSACETGLGDIRNGEGVYGLRRALILAGSRSQLMSLWKVDDEATRDLMVDYYKRLQAGEGRTEALRQVQLSMLTNGGQGQGNRRRSEPVGNEPQAASAPGRSHPYYWAAFIQSGDWRSMNERR